MENKQVLLTTTDNPFNPFDQFEDWINYDITNGYYTCQKIDRLSITSDELSEGENLDSINDAMDELIRVGAINKKGELVEYKKIYKN